MKKILRSEAEILAAWKGDASQPLVSIACNAYNHEAYIEDAIRGFLIQETPFPFRVVLHDDASTDGTAAIIRRYADAYPTILKAVIQEKNLLSRGISRRPWTDPLMLGDYMAFCEGDDYWSDPGKLAFQVEAMKANPSCALSGHATTMVWATGNGASFVRTRSERDVEVFPFEKVLPFWGTFVATASLLMKREIWFGIPPWAMGRKGVSGDFLYEFYGSLPGGLLHINRPMAVHRKGVPQSYTSRSRKSVEMQLAKTRRTMIFLARARRGLETDSQRLALDRFQQSLRIKYAMLLVRCGANAKFRAAIRRAWKRKEHAGGALRLAYGLRAFPPLLAAAYALKRRVARR
jgi:glycosyltransferase involved in cell wall biosynthesis